MFFFGHEGPVLGAAWLGYRLLRNTNKTPPSDKPNPDFFRGNLDFRAILLGALLPDLIDKPIGHLLLKDELSTGRLFGHTLLFFLLLLTAGLWLYQKRKPWLLIIAIGVLGHLILDELWLYPKNLFWPLFGWQFPRLEIEVPIVKLWLEILLTNARVFSVEIIGFLIVLLFFLRLLKRKKIRLFIKRGAID